MPRTVHGTKGCGRTVSFVLQYVYIYIREIIMCELQECQVMNIPDMVDLMDEEHLGDAQCTRFTNV